MMRKLVPMIWVVLAIWVAGCSSNPGQPATTVQPEEIPVSGGVYKEVSIEELKLMLEDKDFTFVNVHIPFEGDLPQTDISIAYNEIDQNLNRLPADKDAKIVLYCRSDRMSTIASETLVELGYTNVWNVDGGMAAWEQAGYPLEGLQ